MNSETYRFYGWSVVWALLATLLVPTARCATTGADRARHKYLQLFCEKVSLADSAVPTDVRDRLNGSIKTEVTDAQGTRWRATAKGLVRIVGGKEPAGRLAGKGGLPILELTGIAAGPDGRLWLATADGAICFRPPGSAGVPPAPDASDRERWFYFWGKRYLADNTVENIVAEPGGAWIRTHTGISHVQFMPYDLEQKCELFEQRIRQRHNRYGFVADSQLPRAGDVTSNRPGPTDNDGLWTAIYVGAECFRYGVTHSPEALRKARASLAALMRLESITGIPGFPARALIHRGDYRDPDGEWHWTPDGELEWKGDTSSDELVGHFFAYDVAYDLLPDEADRAAIRPLVGRIAGHLLDHDLKLVGYGGRVTTWGDYTLEYFQTPNEREDKALNSLEILSHLRVAYHVTGQQRFRTEYYRIANELGYLCNVTQGMTETPPEVNYSDEELAFLAWYPLMRVEDDAQMRSRYRQALENFWYRRIRSEENPLWNYIYAAGTGAKDYAADDALRALERIPLDTVSWTVKNSQRADLPIVPARDRFGEKQAGCAIPPNERPVMKWNGNPFELDGGDDGRSEDDGAFFLLPYWLARFHGLIK